MLSEKKQRKMSSLLDSAYELFGSKGVNETSIDEIVKKARVAKGTFYLYFKDKYDLLDRIVLRKSAALIGSALEALEEEPLKSAGFEERVVFFIDYMIRYLRHDQPLLKILYKNLSWGILADAIESEEARRVIERFCADLCARGSGEKEARQTLYIILELVGSTCYSAIIDEKPYTMEEIKPTLLALVGKMLR